MSDNEQKLVEVEREVIVAGEKVKTKVWVEEIEIKKVPRPRQEGWEANKQSDVPDNILESTED